MRNRNRAPKTIYKEEERTMDDLMFEGFKEESTPNKEYTVKVAHPSLRMRKAPNLQAEVAGLITDQGYYKIIDEANGWGKLENGNWIMLSYTEIAY